MAEDDFSVLAKFLDRLKPEVSGRGYTLPTGEMRERLLRFAAGSCSEGEVKEICDVLRANPDWIRWVADQVKQSRPNTPDTAA